VTQLHQTSYNIAQIRASDHRPVYATFTTEVHIIDHAKEESIRQMLSAEILKREVKGTKGNRRPPPLPATKKLDVADLDRSFNELTFDTSRPANGVRGGEVTGVIQARGIKAGAKRELTSFERCHAGLNLAALLPAIPPPRPPKPSTSANKGKTALLRSGGCLLNFYQLESRHAVAHLIID
jgi:hypothetical protein